MRRCDCCCFFQPNPPAELPDRIVISGDAINGGGECHRRPPVQDDLLSVARFPLVATNGWCGEFRPAEQTDE